MVKKPIGQRWLLRRGWSQNSIDMFVFAWINLTLAVGVILLVVVCYE